jgi:hypothetical protein
VFGASCYDCAGKNELAENYPDAFRICRAERVTANPEAIGSSVGLVPTNAVSIKWSSPRIVGKPKVGQKRRSRKYRFDTQMARPVVTRAAEKKNGTGSSV